MTMTELDHIGKLFIGGLTWETTKENLRDYFGRFGEITDSIVMKNHETGKSRGFGFITFKEPSCVSDVLRTGPHVIDGRKVDAKECAPRHLQKGKKQGTPFKLFLGGLPPDITESAIKDALSSFGKVSQIMIMFDPETKKCRGFGFLSFESEESIDQACAARYVNINGKQIECKRAEPRTFPERKFSQPYDSYKMGQSGPKQFPYGAVDPSTYHASFNAPAAQSYTMPGSSFNYHHGYSSQASNSSDYSMPYMSSMPSSANSTGTANNYGYSSTTGSNYMSSGPSQTPVAPVNTVASPFGFSYTQYSSSYGPSKTYNSVPSSTYGAAERSPGSFGSAQATRGMGYHPYKQ